MLKDMKFLTFLAICINSCISANFLEMTRTKAVDLVEVKSLEALKIKTVKELGIGGTSYVYLAVKEVENKKQKLIAYKKIDEYTYGPEELNQSNQVMLLVKKPELLKYFGLIQEAYLVENIPNYNIFILEYYPLTFSEIVKNSRLNSLFTPELKIYYLAQLAYALNILHQRNICFNDLKPDNIAMNREAQLVIIDFGTICINTKRLEGCNNLSTPSYLPIEALEVKDSKGYGFSSDCWAYGLIALEWMLDYKGESLVKYGFYTEIIKQIRKTDWNGLIDSAVKNVPAKYQTLMTFILKGVLQINPENRLTMDLISAQMLKDISKNIEPFKVPNDLIFPLT